VENGMNEADEEHLIFVRLSASTWHCDWHEDWHSHCDARSVVSWKGEESCSDNDTNDDDDEDAVDNDKEYKVEAELAFKN